MSIVLLIYMLLLLIARIRVAVNRSQMKVTCSALNSFFQDAIQVVIIFFTKREVVHSFFIELWVEHLVWKVMYS